MKKTIFFLPFMLGFCLLAHAQVAKQKSDCQEKIDQLISQRDSMLELYNYTLVALDSTVGISLGLKQQLNTAKRKISDQNIRIQKLEGDVKRLSQSAKKN